MKKLSLIASSLIVSASLHAAVVASVDGKDITDTQVNEAFAGALNGQSINALPADQKRAVVQQYIANQFVLDEAKKQNVEKEAFYKKELEVLKDQLAINAYQKKVFDSVKISNDTLKTTYENNKANFVNPARAQARHILVANEAEAKNIIKDLSKLKGDALVNKFSEIASTKSIDTGSAQRGGELGWFSAEQMVKPFSDATFSLKNGEITKTPVKTQYGYHIILKEKSESRKQLSFDEVKAGLEQQLKAQETQRIISQKVQDQFAKAKVEYK